MVAAIRRPGESWIAGWLFALALGVYLFTAGGSLTTTDAVVTFDVTENIVEHQSVATSGNLLGLDALRGRDGRYYSPFGITQSIYNIPFYLAGRTFVRLTGVTAGKTDAIPKAFVALGQTLVGALLVVGIFRLSAAMTGDVVSSALAALTFAVGSILWPYARFGFNQPLACVTMLASVTEAYLGVRAGQKIRLVRSGLWFALGLLTRHEMGASVVPIAAFLWLDGRQPWRVRFSRLLAFAPGVVAGIAIWLAFNNARFGNPFDSGHLRDPTPGFGSPIVPGLLGLLVSPSTSIFLYSPVVLFGLVGLTSLFKRDSGAAWLSASTIALFLLLYASLGNWIGGRSYGSRYLVVVLPYFAVGWAAMLSSLSPRARAWIFAVVTIAGIAVQIPGVFVDYAQVSESTAASAGGRTTGDRQWDWRVSPLVLNARVLPRVVRTNVDYALGRRPKPKISRAAGNADRAFSRQFAFSLDFWWLYLFYLGVLSRLAMLVIVAGFLVWITIASVEFSQSLALRRRRETGFQIGFGL